MKVQTSGDLRFSATDLAGYLACHHLTHLRIAKAHGLIEPPVWNNPVAAAIAERGEEHERQYLERLREEGLEVVDLSEVSRTSEGPEQTREAMAAGAAVIAQAALVDDPPFMDAPPGDGQWDGQWMGIADVLRRVEAPSELGDWSYEVEDTKLARNTAGGTILQLCLYSEMLAGLQGSEPDWFYVVPPVSLANRGRDFERLPYRIADYAAYYRHVKARFLEFSHGVDPGRLDELTYPEPVPHCQICRWWRRCDKRWRDDDHLNLVANISKLQIGELQSREVDTLAELARLALPIPWKPARGSVESYTRSREQARLQLESRIEGTTKYELLEPEEGHGLARLPEPSPLDAFFDIEGDSFAEGGGREYLFGYACQDGDGRVEYHSDWALGPGDEKRMFEGFVRDMLVRWDRDPGFHIYHYAPYEPTALKKLMGRYATCEEEIDRMLRAGVFVDLYSIIRQALIAGVESYSIKKLEPLYGFEREEPLDQVNAKLATVERALEMETVADLPKGILETVERYNEDDCVSTLRLRDWLEARRSELIGRGEEIPRPETGEGEASETLSEKQERLRALRDALLAKVPVASAEWSEEHETWSNEDQATWRLAHMLEFHWREGKASWWDYYRMTELGADELVDEKEGIGHLLHLGEDAEDEAATARCPVHRYSFPLQESSIEPGDTVHWGETAIGTVRAVDGTEIRIKKRQAQKAFHPPAVFAFDQVRTNQLEESLFRLGSWVLEHGVDAPGEHRAARDLLLRVKPRVGTVAPAAVAPDEMHGETHGEAHGKAPGEAATKLAAESGPGTGDALVRDDEDLLPAARRLALALDEGALPVQGPPGSGKTYSGSRMICSLVAAGRKVGITANSHKVIRNLVDKVVRAARKEGVELTVVQKVKEPAEVPPDSILEVKSNDAVGEALESGTAQVAAGTAWLWSRPEYAGSVDTLVVDEAGQLSLATTLAVAQAGRALILLGDPKQLEQPLQGSHPEGTDVSALQHVLGERETMSDDRGLFLARTWRLHPEICRFTSELFYEGRLESRDGLDRQVLSGSDRFEGAGLWLVPVEHAGNQSSSPEEVDAVAGIVEHLVSAGRWTNAEGETRDLGAEDILVVAPFNAQVSLLKDRLGPSARVGTVDKFQGQEAPVVIYSMTTSTPEDAPRGMEFLYSLNRFNVATSRAQCATILIACSRLLEPECRTPRQMELANAYCRYREMAREGERR